MATKLKEYKTYTLFDKLEKDLLEAKKDKKYRIYKHDKNWNFEYGYLISYADLEIIIDYIKGHNKTYK